MKVNDFNFIELGLLLSLVTILVVIIFRVAGGDLGNLLPVFKTLL